MNIATKNEVVGWSSVVEPHIYTLTAVCLQEVKVLAINGPKLRALLRTNRDIGYEVVRELMKVVVSRLEQTRHLLISERMITQKPH